MGTTPPRRSAERSAHERASLPAGPSCFCALQRRRMTTSISRGVKGKVDRHPFGRGRSGRRVEANGSLEEGASWETASIEQGGDRVPAHPKATRHHIGIRSRKRSYEPSRLRAFVTDEDAAHDTTFCGPSVISASSGVLVISAARTRISALIRLLRQSALTSVSG